MNIVSLAMVYLVCRAGTCEGKKKHLFLIMLNIRYTQYIISCQDFSFHQFARMVLYIYLALRSLSDILHEYSFTPGLDLVVAGKKPNDLDNTKQHGDIMQLTYLLMPIR